MGMRIPHYTIFVVGYPKGSMMTVDWAGWVYPRRWAELAQLQTRLVAAQHWHGEPGGVGCSPVVIGML